MTYPRCLTSAALAAGLGACAVLRAPEPVTTLRLPAATATTAWPAALAPGRLDAATALHTDHLLVIDGARVMRHARLRWSDTPPAMIGDTLRLREAAGADRDLRRPEAVARLDLHLDSFELRTRGEHRLATISASVTLRCPEARGQVALGVAEASRDAGRGDEPDVVAQAFADASAELIDRMLTQAGAALPRCAALPNEGFENK